MKKEIIVVFVLVLFLLSACSTGEARRQKLLPAYDESKCVDSDGGVNFEEKGMTQGKYYFNFAAKKDSCNRAGKLIEFYCSRNKVQKVAKDCGELGNDYICKEGVCVSDEDQYFLKNKGTLNCEDSLNQEFCNLYNSSNKYYGLGTHNLNINDLVIVEPFIFKWGFGMLSGNMDVVWVGLQGNPIKLADMGFSPYYNNVYSIQNFQGIYFMTNLNEVSPNHPAPFTFTNSYAEAFNWCESKGVNLYQTEDIISFADEEYSEYNPYLADSLQVCYDKVKDFLQIEPIVKPVQNRFLESEEGGACSAGDAGILCGATKEITDNILLGSWLEAGLTYPEAVEEGNCLDHGAQPHELTHIFIYGTPLRESQVLNEGLAEYVKHKTTFNIEELQCFDEGWVVGSGNNNLYTDLNNFELEISHYKTAACVWDYIDNTYGHEKFIEIIQTMDTLRFTSGTYNLFADIINPILGEDVLLVLQEKFNLDEQIIEIQI